jgi:hypothetical protein
MVRNRYRDLRANISNAPFAGTRTNIDVTGQYN